MCADNHDNNRRTDHNHYHHDYRRTDYDHNDRRADHHHYLHDDDNLHHTRPVLAGGALREYLPVDVF